MTAVASKKKIPPSLQREIDEVLTVKREDQRQVVTYRCQKAMITGTFTVVSHILSMGAITWYMGFDNLFALGAIWLFSSFGFIGVIPMLMTPVRVFVDRGRLHVTRRFMAKTLKSKISLRDLKFEISPIHAGSQKYSLIATDGSSKAYLCNPSSNLELIRALPTFYREVLSLGEAKVEMLDADEQTRYQKAA